MEIFRALPAAARLPLRAYRILFPVVLILMLPGILMRMIRRGNYRHKFGQRLGLYGKADRARLASGGWTWIHAVSVGEMMMGINLGRTLQSVHPGMRVLISTTTSTGYAVAREQIENGGGGMELIYYPLDAVRMVRRVLELIRPAQVVMVDKELWPNMVAECYRRSIPVSVVNARLSPRSERGFRKWRWWVAPFFSMLERVCVQEPDDLERWESLGVRREALVCTGSLKFDFAVAEAARGPEFRGLLERIGVSPEAPILLGGSTFPGEEAILGRVALALRARFPDLFLIVVPRHVERTAEVERDLHALGLATALRSGTPEWPAGSPRPDVLIVNTTGELRDWYALATVCFVGKSLTAIGGQNPAEPVLVGRPVVFGSHMENFQALVRQLLNAGGAVQVPDEAGLLRETEALLGDPARRQELVERARSVLKVHLGANRRTAELLA
jgi:3-deoxy-D-manno-octulosonic-acid transferase